MKAKTPCDILLENYGLPFDLRPDQVLAVNNVCGSDWDKVALFMDVGVGKTVVSTLIAFWWAMRGDIDQILIIMPPIILLQWKEWIETFPDVTTSIYYGTLKQREKIDLSADFVLTSGGIFKNDFEKIKEYYQNKKVLLLVDEAASIRNIETLIYSAVREFVFLTPYKRLLMLTGTALGAPQHAYSYISLKTPDVYRDYLRFVMQHIERTDKFKRVTKYRNLDALAVNLMKQTIWLKAEDVLDLPPVTCVPKIYKLSKQHMKLYNDLVEEKLLELDDGVVLDGTTVERMRHVCQRVIMSPSTYMDSKIVPAGFALIDSFTNELGIFRNKGKDKGGASAGVGTGACEKIVIYCNYRSTNEHTYQYVTEKLKLKAVQAFGKLGPKKNMASIQQFLKDPEVQVLIAHPGSVGIGGNFQSVCRAVLFLEIPTTANTYIQALGRVKREGQKRNIIVWLATAKNTIQVHLRQVVVKSEDMVQIVMPTKETLRSALFGLDIV